MAAQQQSHADEIHSLVPVGRAGGQLFTVDVLARGIGRYPYFQSEGMARACHVYRGVGAGISRVDDFGHRGGYTRHRLQNRQQPLHSPARARNHAQHALRAITGLFGKTGRPRPQSAVAKLLDDHSPPRCFWVLLLPWCLLPLPWPVCGAVNLRNGCSPLCRGPSSV